MALLIESYHIREVRPLYNQLKQIVERRERFALATVVEAGKRELLGQKLLVAESGTFGALKGTQLGARIKSLAEEALKKEDVCLFEIADDVGAQSILVECFHPVARLLVLGGGHIARPLVKIASLLNYEITVIDDRPAFANSERFSEAKEVICDDFVRALKHQRIDPGTSVVIVTRGHKHDLDCLKHVLQYEPGYVGMIGSRRRIKLVKEHLIESGYPRDRVDRVYMPIGLDIGAETPEEIAVSIAAQLVEVRRGVAFYPMPPTSTSEQWDLLARMLEYVNRGEPLVAATVIRTKGSTPRKPGAKMLVLPDGSCFGTIGGGCGEAEVRNEALMLFDSPGIKVYRVMLHADIAAEEGMACGGEMDVFLERLV